MTSLIKNKYDTVIDWTKNELSKLETSKQEVIKEAAEKLVNAGIPKHEVSATLAKELEGYTTAQYIRKCLDDEYKTIEKRHLDIKSDEKLVSHDTINTTEEVEPITISNEGRPTSHVDVIERIKNDFDNIDFRKVQKIYNALDKPESKDGDETDYKALCDDLFLKLAKWEYTTTINYQGAAIPLLIEVSPSTKTVTVSIAE